MNRRNLIFLSLLVSLLVTVSCLLFKGASFIDANTCSSEIVVLNQGEMGGPANDTTLGVVRTVYYHTQIKNVGSGTAKNLVVHLDWYDLDQEMYLYSFQCSLSPENNLGPEGVLDVNCIAPREVADESDYYTPRFSIQCEAYEEEKDSQTNQEGAAEPDVADTPPTGETADIPVGDLRFQCAPQKGYLIRLLEPEPGPSAHTVDSAEMDYTVTISLTDQSLTAWYSSDILITKPLEYQDSITREWKTRYFQERHERSGRSVDYEFLADNWFTFTAQDETNVSSNEKGSWEANPPIENTRNVIGYVDIANNALMLCDNWSTPPDGSAWIQNGPENFQSSCTVDLYTCSMKP